MRLSTILRRVAGICRIGKGRANTNRMKIKHAELIYRNDIAVRITKNMGYDHHVVQIGACFQPLESSDGLQVVLNILF